MVIDMDPHEILPMPEAKKQSEQLERVDDYNELASDMAVETKQGPRQGSLALSGVAVDDASGQVQAVQGQVASDIGGTASSSILIDVPEVAGDIDLIEKEWVRKAKDIVMRTQGDPYTQNKQINRMKVEYIKKRYDKDIRSSEER
jgi:hypothetical protein